MSATHDRARVQAAVEAIGSQHLPCSLCHRPAAECVAAFAPTDPDLQRRVGTPAGKLRVLFYPICALCAETASIETREAVALRTFHMAMQRERAAQQ